MLTICRLTARDTISTRAQGGVFTAAPSAARRAGSTGTLTMRYRQPGAYGCCGGKRRSVENRVNRRETRRSGSPSADERVLVVGGDGLFADGLAALARGFGMEARRTKPADMEDVTRTFRPTVLLVASAHGEAAPAAPNGEANGDASVRILWFDEDRETNEALSQFFDAGLRITRDSDPVHFRAILAGSPREAATVADDAVTFRPGGTTDDERIFTDLTVRERSVLEELASGGTNGAIAQRLSVSPNTVRTHVQNIFHKLDVGSRLEAVAFAAAAGLLSADADVRP